MGGHHHVHPTRHRRPAGLDFANAVWAFESFHGFAGLTAVLFAFIFVAGEMEYRAVQRREIEDEQWRAMLARLYPVEPPAAEPPVLTR